LKQNETCGRIKLPDLFISKNIVKMSILIMNNKKKNQGEEQ